MIPGNFWGPGTDNPTNIGAVHTGTC